LIEEVKNINQKKRLKKVMIIKLNKNKVEEEMEEITKEILEIMENKV
jgi:hypothetical protein